ncbi:hypothetical protein FPZ54_04495 [Sphingomonas suaedae]|uniref:CBM-cenC domain-containing protein n=1 Tax=Sphingomonas suaedae TaxID=2599297 RepID=A0A518RD10_9SPHN|nr:hypothetical protein [Sphingomonas suaedae]QDX25357.1 hypothetical protein FPZ54_04495 [Sphingomonas suaedae]
MRSAIAAILTAVATPALCGTVTVAMSGQAASEPTILNEPSANWTVYGPGQTHKGRKDPAVQGGGAMRVAITAKPANPWDIGASSPIKGAIAKGDRLVLAFWARLADGGADGRTTIAGAIQQASPPYAAIVSGSVELTGDWTLVHIKGIAASGHAAGTANVALTLGGAAHTIDLGPVFVLKSA